MASRSENKNTGETTIAHDTFEVAKGESSICLGLANLDKHFCGRPYKAQLVEKAGNGDRFHVIIYTSRSEYDTGTVSVTVARDVRKDIAIRALDLIPTIMSGKIARAEARKLWQALEEGKCEGSTNLSFSPTPRSPKKTNAGSTTAYDACKLASREPIFCLNLAIATKTYCKRLYKTDLVPTAGNSDRFDIVVYMECAVGHTGKTTSCVFRNTYKDIAIRALDLIALIVDEKIPMLEARKKWQQLEKETDERHIERLNNDYEITSGLEELD